jgi:hypothetical protein
MKDFFVNYVTVEKKIYDSEWDRTSPDYDMELYLGGKGSLGVAEAYIEKLSYQNYMWKLETAEAFGDADYIIKVSNIHKIDFKEILTLLEVENGIKSKK